METERRIASVPVRSVTQTSDRFLEFAAAWGGSERIGDLSPAAPILRALILDRILQRSPVVVEYESHRLRLFCEYEDEALDISPEDEDLPSRLPHPVGGDVSWRMVVPCPDGLVAWATDQAGMAGITGWFVVAGPDGKVQSATRAPSDARAEMGGAVEIDTEALQRLIDQNGRR